MLGKPLGRNLTFVIALLCTGSALTPFAQAETDANNALKHCATIPTPTERLACYDALAGRPSIAAPSSTESFGLRPVQMAPRETIGTVAAQVDHIAVSRGGRTVLVLDNQQSWELDGGDELLAPGDAVTISRASLGSFLLRTARGRTHRATRIR